MFISPTEADAVRAVYVIYLGAIFIPPFFLHFILSLLDQDKGQRTIVIFSYLSALIEVALLIGGQFTQGVRQYPNLGFYEIPNRGYIVFFVFFVCLPSYAIFKVTKAYMETEILVRRNQLKYVIYSSLIGFLAGGTSFFPFANAGLLPIGAPLSYCFTFPIAYAIARYRLMDINIVVKKSLIYTFLLLALLIPCYLLVIWGQTIAFGNVNYYFSIFTLLLFLLVGFMFPKFRFRTEEALERVLFKKRYDHRETLHRSSIEMISVVDLETLSNNLVQTVSKALGIEKTSLFLSDEIKGLFAFKANVGFGQDQFKDYVLLRNDPLVRRFRMNPEALVREELEMVHDGPEPRDLAVRMGEIGAEVSMPLISKEKLIGILNLGHKNRREMYSNEELEVLSTLANQTAIAIENALLYENLKESQSIIHRANRLSSLGMLTAGLAHEIRNPLVAIRTFTQLLPERYKDEEFRDSFRSLALKEVDRICGLVNDLLSFARPSAPKVDREDVNEIFESIARILETEAKEKGVTVKLHLASGLPKILVDKEQIKQVSMNVILNAIQSIKDEGVVEVFSRLFVKDGREHFVQIEVRDTGIGILERDLENIFNPFFTTKENGSGLGLSISHQIVREHGGYIAVESKAGVGTTFFINFLVSQVNYLGTNDRLQDHEKDFGR
jgi:signal transduction histidine kinase